MWKSLKKPIFMGVFYVDKLVDMWKFGRFYFQISAHFFAFFMLFSFDFCLAIGEPSELVLELQILAVTSSKYSEICLIFPAFFPRYIWKFANSKILQTSKLWKQVVFRGGRFRQYEVWRKLTTKKNSVFKASRRVRIVLRWLSTRESNPAWF